MRGNLLLSAAALVAVTAMWGGVFVVAEVAMAGVPPLTVAFVRFLLASLLFLPPYLPPWRRPLRIAPGDWLRLLALGGLGIAGYNAFLNLTVAMAGPAQASLLIPTTLPAATVLLASLVLREPLTGRRFLGVAMAALGVACVVGGAAGQTARASLPALLFAGLAVLFFALFTVYGRPLTGRYAPLDVIAVQTWLGTPFLLPLALAEGPVLRVARAAGPFWWEAIYLALFGSILPYVLWYEAVRRLGAGRTAVFTSLVPCWAIAFSYLFLGERVTAIQALGGLLAVAGILVVNTGSGEAKGAEVISGQGGDQGA